MVGFVQNLPGVSGTSGSMANHEVRCFHGMQKEAYNFEKSVAHENGKIKWNELVEKHDIVPENLLAVSTKKTKKEKPSKLA
jgi:uncharacterized FlgJ-related protein